MTAQRSEGKYLLLPLAAAIIWGLAFVFQRDVTRYLGTFSFGTARFLLGAFSQLSVILIRQRRPGAVRLSLKDAPGGCVVGAALFIASALQQEGLRYMGAGQGAFLSALYVVLVPVIGLIFGNRVSVLHWAALGLSVPALYLLCVTEGGFTFNGAVLLELGSAVFWALQILSTDHFGRKRDSTCLCFFEFLSCGIFYLIALLITETPTLQGYLDALPAILYVGIMSTAVAFTLQTIGQKHTNPAHAALLLSLESVFSVLGGAALLGEKMTVAGYIGCVLMLGAVLLSQFSGGKRNA